MATDEIQPSVRRDDAGPNISLLLIIQLESTKAFPIIEMKGINDVLMPSISQVPR